MRSVILLTWYSLSAPLLAQTGFYLRPSAETKFSVSNEKPFGFTTDQGNRVDVVPTRVLYPAGLSVGLAVGYKTERWYLEIHTFQDEALAGARRNNSSINPNDPDMVYVQSGSYYHGGSYARYSMNYGVNLSGHKAQERVGKARWELWGFAGIDYWRRPPIPAESPTGGLWLFNEQDSMSYFADMQTPLRTSFFVTGGLTLKGYNRKGRSIFNVGVFYSQAVTRRVMATSALTFTNYTDGKQYFASIRSKGSGIYFQLSKDIYLNNIFKRKKHVPLD